MKKVLAILLARMPITLTSCDKQPSNSITSSTTEESSTIITIPSDDKPIDTTK